jgi:hypothetical protein
MLVFSDSANVNILSAITISDTPLYHASVTLFVNNIQPVHNSVATDFVLSVDTAMQHSSPISWQTPFLNSDGNAAVLGDVKQFNPTTVQTPPDTFYGYYLSDAVGNYLAGEAFATPVQVTSLLDSLAVVPQVELGDQS